MCRHIGYIGNKAKIKDVLVDKEHSIIDMAFKPKEMKNAKLNADGFGIGWCKYKDFYSYKNCLPIWNDINFFSIIENIESNLIIGNVRSATLPNYISYHNTHPFKWKNFLFSHNGYIKDFEKSVKKEIVKLLDYSYLSPISGNTDSEHIFFLIMQIYNQEKNLKKAIFKTIDFLTTICEEAMLNFMLAHITEKEGFRLLATKASINIEAPSLYYLIENDRNIYISSEKLNKQNWKGIMDSSIIECDNNKVLISKIK